VRDSNEREEIRHLRDNSQLSCIREQTLSVIVSLLFLLFPTNADKSGEITLRWTLEEAKHVKKNWHFQTRILYRGPSAPRLL
jgi:hypothetical protein